MSMADGHTRNFPHPDSAVKKIRLGDTGYSFMTNTENVDNESEK
jgi:hypothetical protein